MPEYAILKAHKNGALERGATLTFEFGPVRYGKITVSAEGVQLRPLIGRHGREDIDDDRRPPRATKVRIALLDGRGAVVATSDTGHLEYEVSPPRLGALVRGYGPKWRCRLENIDFVKAAVFGTVAYPSWQELDTKVVPMTWFQQKFDILVNDNATPPLTITIDHRGDPEDDDRDKNMAIIEFAPYVRMVYEMDAWMVPVGDDGKIEVPHLGNDIRIRDLRSNRIRLSAATVRPEGGAGGWSPRIRVEVWFEEGGDTEVDINNLNDVDLKNMRLTVDLHLTRKGVLVSYDASADMEVSYSINNAPDWIYDAGAKVKSEVKEAIEKKANDQGARHKAGKFLTRLLLGDDLEVRDVYGSDGNLHVTYVKALPPDTSDVLVNPDYDVTPGEDTSDNLVSKIDHIVFVMMENRSFDHMFGYLRRDAGRGEVEGLRGGETNEHEGKRYESYRLDTTWFGEHPCHNHDCFVRQIDGGTMGGFVADFALRYSGENTLRRVMGYYDGEHLPVYDTFAREFAICDRWFCSLPAATWPNRFFQLTGKLPRDHQGRPTYESPDLSHFGGWSDRTIFDVLTERGIGWKYYEHDFCFLRLFDAYKFDLERVVEVSDPQRGFFADAQNGRLPPVSFLDPNFFDVPGSTWNDDHPPADVKNGQRLIAQIYNAIVAGPQWNDPNKPGKVMFVITYDEHGGFYDHVPPPSPGWGIRVPGIVVSPWVPRGHVAKEQLDHTVVVQSIIRRFLRANPPNLGNRVKASRDLGALLTAPAARTDYTRTLNPTWPTPPTPPTPPDIDLPDRPRVPGRLFPPGHGPSIPRLAPDAAAAIGGRAVAEAAPRGDDFHSLMRAYRDLVRAERPRTP